MYLDFLRLAAAFLVIVNHTNSRVFTGSGLSLTWYTSVTYFFLSKIAVPVFLMITGAVSIEKEPGWKGYGRRVLRVLIILAAANLFYYIHSVLTNPRASFTARGFVWALFHSSALPLWYLYVYLICTMFMPFFRKLASVMDRREERLFLLLSVGLNGVLGMLPLLCSAAKVNEIYAAATVNSYVGLLFAGHYFEKYVKVRGRTALIAAVVWAAILALEVWLTVRFYRQSRADYLVLEERTYLTVVAQAWCAFVIVKYLFRNAEKHPRLSRTVCFLGRQTFGVYLLGELGIFWLKDVYPALTAHSVPRMAAMVIYEAAVFAACLLVTILLRCIPAVRKYI